MSFSYEHKILSRIPERIYYSEFLCPSRSGPHKSENESEIGTATTVSNGLKPKKGETRVSLTDVHVGREREGYSSHRVIAHCDYAYDRESISLPAENASFLVVGILRYGERKEGTDGRLER